jgi:hypothetical protein
VSLSLRIARLLLALALAALASGAPTVVRAALHEECCEQGCDYPDEGKPCPPDCGGPCAKVATPLPVTPARCLARAPEARSVASTGAIAPVLPLVVSGVFHPPRS